MIVYTEKGAGLGEYLQSFGITLSEVYENGAAKWESNAPDELVNAKIAEYNPWAVEKAKKFAEINDWLENQIQLVLSGIPKSEQASWPTQVAEARGVQPLSMLIGIASRRGISVEELKAKVLAKEQMFSDYYSVMQGERDRVETLVKAMPDDGEYHRLPELWALSCTV